MFEGITNFFDRFTHQFVMETLFAHAQWVDWFAVLFIVLGIIYGVQNGFFAEVAEIFQIMFVIYLVLEHYKKLQRVLLLHVTFIPDESTAGAAYILMGIVIWVTAGLLTRFLRRFFHIKAAQPLRRAGGAVLGAFHLFVIFSFLCQTLLLLPVRQPKRAFEKGGSYMGHFAAQLAPRIHDMIAQPASLVQDADEQ